MATDPSRTLVLCFDGTSDAFTSKNTNVVKLFSLLEKDDQTRQLCYYQSGIGTYTNPGIMSPIAKWFAMMADEAVAWYLDHHVMGGYKFLMENYCEGDKICLFGFSRGAYTARALAAMLYRVGLISRGNDEQITFAYKMYAKTGKKSDNQARLFKATFARPVYIEFVGCWDTVSSTGLLYSKQLPFTSSTTVIKTFRHALALDEHRSRFQPNVWHRIAPNKAAAMLDPQHSSPVEGHPSPMPPVLQLPGEQASQPVRRPPTDVLEVWFSGCHSDIGGGNYPNPDQVTLADVTLRWMVREIVKAQTGILFNSQALQESGIPSSAFLVSSLLCSPNHRSLDIVREKSEGNGMANGKETAHATDPPNQTEKKDDRDSLKPINDALKQKPIWWLVEVLPFPVSWQDAKGVWLRKWRVNFGRGRTIYDAEPKLYVTVKERMQDKSLSYKPRAKYSERSVVWVDE